MSGWKGNWKNRERRRIQRARAPIDIPAARRSVFIWAAVFLCLVVLAFAAFWLRPQQGTWRRLTYLGTHYVRGAQLIPYDERGNEQLQRIDPIFWIRIERIGAPWLAPVILKVETVLDFNPPLQNIQTVPNSGLTNAGVLEPIAKRIAQSHLTDTTDSNEFRPAWELLQSKGLDAEELRPFWPGIGNTALLLVSLVGAAYSANRVRQLWRCVKSEHDSHRLGCPSCLYDLDNLIGAERCPECGQRLAWESGRS